jgi:alpha-1,2-mannosyltransferase
MRSLNTPRPILLLAGIFGLLGWTLALLVLTGHVSVLGPGTDWLAFYGAARAYLDGRIALIFDSAAFTAYLNADFGSWLAQPLAFRPWVYPPSFLLLLVPFGALPLAASYVLFELASGAALLLALVVGSDRPEERWLVIVSGFWCFGAAHTVMQGQNAFLIAALLIGGWRAIRFSPVLGGVLLGLATIKPQLFVLVPIALIGAREWRALAAAIVSVTALAGISAALLGIEAWSSWLDFARHPGEWIANARLFGTSWFAFLAGLGLSWNIAEALQMIVTAASAVIVYLSCRSAKPRDQQLAILLAATLIAAPHSSFYDTLLLAIAVTLWIVDAAERGSALLRSEFALLVWVAPLFEAEMARGFVPLLASAFIVVVLTCWMRDNAAQPEVSQVTVQDGATRATRSR